MYKTFKHRLFLALKKNLYYVSEAFETHVNSRQYLLLAKI